MLCESGVLVLSGLSLPGPVSFIHAHYQVEEVLSVECSYHEGCCTAVLRFFNVTEQKDITEGQS